MLTLLCGLHRARGVYFICLGEAGDGSLQGGKEEKGRRRRKKKEKEVGREKKRES